jgi:polyhydroxyalkanoate synthesis regulator phasin
MSPDTLSETIQKGFRVTLGATASLVEAIRDPQGSQAKFSAIGNDFERLAEEFELKGADTEREARAMVDSMMSQMGQMPNPFASTPASEVVVNTYATPIADAGVQSELDSLTQELATLRQEIETLKAQRE